MLSRVTTIEWAVWAVRWLARCLSVASIATLALFVVGDVPTPSRVTAAEGLALVFFPVGVVVGMAVAWKWEGIGGGIGLASLALFYLVHRLMLSDGYPRGWWFVIFSLPLFLFLGVWAATTILLREESAWLSQGNPSPPAAG